MQTQGPGTLPGDPLIISESVFDLTVQYLILELHIHDVFFPFTGASEPRIKSGNIALLISPIVLKPILPCASMQAPLDRAVKHHGTLTLIVILTYPYLSEWLI